MSSANTVDIGQNLGNVGIDNLARETLGDRRLADARIADQERIVLLAPAQHLDGALDLGLAADEGIDAPLTRLPVEVDRGIHLCRECPLKVNTTSSTSPRTAHKIRALLVQSPLP